MMEFLAEFLAFLKHRRKYWLIPVMVMLLVLGGLVVLVKGTAVAPLIYTMF